MTDIDARDFGRLESEVAALTRQVGDLTVKVDSLLELAAKGRGAFWLALIVGGVVGSMLSTVSSRVLTRLFGG
jgi:hypothetical protein